MALKILDASGNGSTSNAIEAIEYVVNIKKHYGHNIRVINNSWGGASHSRALRTAIEKLKKQKILFIASAGNNSQLNDKQPHYPCSYPTTNIISVASTNQHDNLSWFSNYGRKSVDVAAPGSDILSTFRGDGYRYFSGISMAAPHVSGLAGLIWANHPEWSWFKVRDKVFKWILYLQLKKSTGENKCYKGGRIAIKKRLYSGTAYLCQYAESMSFQTLKTPATQGLQFKFRPES